MINKVLNYIKQNRMIEEGEGVVLGVSGGADSVCLLLIMHEISIKMNLSLYVVHINHGIRGNEADSDERYVEQLCTETGVWCKSFHYDIPALSRETGMSEEEAGRKMRYETFKKVLIENKASKIAVAHNSDDSVETVLYNMCRGTGIKGVTGIPAVRGNIIRPILCCSRKEVEQYLGSINFRYCTDSTNLKNDYTRNKIRNELLPYLRDNINSRSQEHIMSLASQLQDIGEYMKEQVLKAYMECVKENKDNIMISKSLFVNYPKIIKQEIVRKCIENQAGKLKDITSVHIESVINIIENGTGRRINLPYSIVCENVYDDCYIRKQTLEYDDAGEEIDIKIPGTYHLLNGSVIDFKLENSINFEEKLYTKWFDYDKIINAIKLRYRESGDYLTVSDGGHKKLKSYLIDEKVPREQRGKIPLLADDHHIMWVIGYRISEAYKITSNTKNVLKVQYFERDGNNNGR